MIYILPTRHDIQLGLGANPKFLLDYIDNLVVEHSIDFIAEEVHPDELLGDSISPIGRFAHQNDLSYVHLDPSSAKEKELGLPTPQEVISAKNEEIGKAMMLVRARKREDYWLPTILKVNKSYKNILLVCGANHVSKNPESGGKGIDSLLRDDVQTTIFDNFLDS